MAAYPEWTATPSCSTTDPEMWFADEETSVYPDIKLLQRVCAECPVRQQCFDYALSVNVEGYWAGTTPRIREKMRARLGIKPDQLIYGWNHDGSIRL